MIFFYALTWLRPVNAALAKLPEISFPWRHPVGTSRFSL